MSASRPVLFGEVLFDRFPDGMAVLGGAPFNVAWHLQAFGLEPLFISCVGDDPAGRELLAAMRTWGMDTAGIQVDGERPTGAVHVHLDGGEPSYDILADQAYDHIRADQLPPVAPGELLCHGTLALRAPDSSAALAALRAARPRRLVDVNLRRPFWERDEVLTVLRGAAGIKLNEEELGRLSGSPIDATSEAGAVERAALGLLADCAAERVVVTRGERGVLAVDPDQGTLIGVPEGAVQIIDTVGAGDAFTAVLMLGACQHWELGTTLQRGLDFAEVIVSMRGATTANPDFYTPFQRLWALT